MDLKKNDELVIIIDDLGSQGEGIGHVDGYALFVKGALPGERVRVRLMKQKKTYGFARLIEVLEPSSERVEAVCPVSSSCGGCTWQHISYREQLAFKEKRVRDCLTRIGGVDLDRVTWLPILGMDEEPWHYRNKAQFPVREDERGIPQKGFFASHSHRLIPVGDCEIQHPVINQVIDTILKFMREYHVRAYQEQEHRGLVRHIYVRHGYHTGQIMVCVVINGSSLPHSEKMVERLCKIQGMTSIYLNVNKEKTNVILGKEMKRIYGDPYIEDTIGDIRYRISPQSFYQVNPRQTEKLYQTALSFADLKGDEIVWDLYCGIGTISLFLAKNAKHVTGVELVPQAIENARENARINGIQNVEFHCGSAGEIAEKLYRNQDLGTHRQKSQKANVVVVDPPRKGCDAALLDTIVKMQPDKIVYVSCDPATLARDVKMLGENGYRLEKVQACDMFPQGGHVETVACLQRVDM